VDRDELVSYAFRPSDTSHLPLASMIFLCRLLIAHAEIIEVLNYSLSFFFYPVDVYPYMENRYDD
jgi:hypothetical protein